MPRSKRSTSWWPIATLLAGAALVTVALWPQIQALYPTPTPTRVAVADVAPTPSSSPTVEPTAEPVEIAASDILNVSIPAVELDVRVSGETWPRESPRCKGGTTECIDPPLADQAAWYGALPASQSAGTVRLFGHTDSSGRTFAAFNALTAVQANDEVIVETETGIFTYRAVQPQLVPYVEVIESALIWDNSPDRLVLVTCNNQESSGTVIEAWLVSAVPHEQQ